MKKFFKEPCFLSCILFAAAFAVLWSVWYFKFRYSLIWLEGVSYFSNTPDFRNIVMDLPEDWAGYVVAFLLQMYRWPAVAAAIQTLLALIPVFAVYVIIRNLLRKDRAWRWVSISLAVISLYVSVSLIVTLNDLPEIDEEIAKLEYMAEHRQ